MLQLFVLNIEVTATLARVCCKSCGHRAEPDIAEQVARFGAGMAVIEWARRLCCSGCGGSEIDFVVSGAAPAIRCS